MFTVVPESVGDEDRTGSVALGELSSVIDDIVREGARRLLAEALAAEVEVCIAGLAEERDEAGRRLVVRNGYHEPREVLTSAGPKSPEDKPCRYSNGNTSLIFGGFRAGAGTVPRLVRGAVVLGDHQADRDLAWRATVSYTHLTLPTTPYV